MTRIPLYLIIPLFLLISACSGHKSGNSEILSEEKMVTLLVETHLADGILGKDESPIDKKRDMALYFYPSVLDKYGVTKAQMDSSVTYYIRNPKAYLRIYDKVIKELEKKKTVIEDKELIEQP